MLAGAVSPRRIRISTEHEVRALSDRFYSALSHLDLPQLADIWSHKGSITTVHPMGGEQVGRPEVHKAFEEAAGALADVHVELDKRITEAGQEPACETGIERGSGKIAGEQIQIEQRVTNVYRREGGQWKTVHHHADISPAMVQLLQRLRAA